MSIHGGDRWSSDQVGAAAPGGNPVSAACVAFPGAMTSPSLGSRLPEPDPRSDRRAMTLSRFGISLSTQTPRAVVESAWCAVASRVVSRGVEVGPAALARAPRAIYRVVEQLVARRAHIPEVAGSSPARATSRGHRLCSQSGAISVSPQINSGYELGASREGTRLNVRATPGRRDGGERPALFNPRRSA